MHFSQVQLNAVVAGRYFRNIDKNRDERLDENELKEFHSKIATAVQNNDTAAARAALKAADDLLKDMEAQKAASGRQMQYNNSREGFYNRTNPDQGELYTISWLDLVTAATGRKFDREMEVKADLTSTSNMYQHFIGSPDNDKLVLSQNVEDGITEFTKISMVLFGEASTDMLPNLPATEENEPTDSQTVEPRQRSRRPHDSDLLGLDNSTPRRTQSIYQPTTPEKPAPPEYWSQLPQDVKAKLEDQFRKDIQELLNNQTPENMEKAQLVADLYKKLSTDELPLSVLQPKPIPAEDDENIPEEESITDDTGTNPNTSNPITERRPSVQERIALEKEKILARQRTRQAKRSERAQEDIYKPMAMPTMPQMPWAMPMNPMGSPAGVMIPPPFLWNEFRSIIGTCSWATGMPPTFYAPPMFMPPIAPQIFPSPMPMGMMGSSGFMPPISPQFNFGFDSNYNPAAMIMSGATMLLNLLFPNSPTPQGDSNISSSAEHVPRDGLEPNLKAAVMQQYDISLQKSHDMIEPGNYLTLKKSREVKDEAIKILEGIMNNHLPPDALAKFNDMLSGVSPHDPSGYHQQMFNAAINGEEPLIDKTRRQLEESPKQVEQGKKLAAKSANPQEVLNKYGALYQSIMAGRTDPGALEGYTGNLQNEALNNRPIDEPNGNGRSPEQIGEAIVQSIQDAADNNNIPRLLIEPGDNPQNFIQALKLINPAYKDIPDVDIFKAIIAANMGEYPANEVFRPGNEIKLPDGFLTDIGLEELERTGIDKGANLPPLTQENIDKAWKDLIITDPYIEGIEDFYADGAEFIDAKFKPSEPPNQNLLIKQSNGTYTFADGNGPPQNYLNAEYLYAAVSEGKAADTEGNIIDITPDLKQLADAKLKHLVEPFKKDLVDEYKLHMQENIVFNQWLNGKVKMESEAGEIIAKILTDKGLDPATADPKSIKNEILDTLKRDAKRYLWLREQLNHNDKALTDEQKLKYQGEQDALISRSPLLLNLDAVKDTKDGLSFFDDAKGGFRTLWGLAGRNEVLSDDEIEKEVDKEISKVGGIDNIIQLAEKKACDGLTEARDPDFANVLLHDTGLTITLAQRMIKTTPIPDDQSDGLVSVAMYAIDNKKSCTEMADKIATWTGGAGIVVSMFCPPVGAGLFAISAGAKGYSAYKKWNMAENNFRALESSADGVSKVGLASSASELQGDATQDAAWAAGELVLTGAAGKLAKYGLRTLRPGATAAKIAKSKELATKAADLAGQAAAKTAEANKITGFAKVFNSNRRELLQGAKKLTKESKSLSKMATKLGPTKWIQKPGALTLLTGVGYGATTLTAKNGLSSLTNPLGNRAENQNSSIPPEGASHTTNPEQTIVQQQGDGYHLIADQSNGLAKIVMQDRQVEKVQGMLQISKELIDNGALQNITVELKTQAQQITASRLIQSQFPQLVDKVNFVMAR